eukprot:SAG11_NODE_4662_length_1816_cov_4.829936_1_plen_70_part_00
MHIFYFIQFRDLPVSLVSAAAQRCWLTSSARRYCATSAAADQIDCLLSVAEQVTYGIAGFSLPARQQQC